jgi:hypothetical protein
MSKPIPEKDWINVKIEDATVPKDGYVVIKDRWWAVKDGKIRFYRTYCSPQCNSNKTITEQVGKKWMDSVQFIPVVFTPHNCNDYV